MTSQDALLILRRYQRWRRGDSDKTFDESGLDVKEIGQALDHVLSALPVVQRELASARSQLAKCQVQRERFHAELRRQARGQKSEAGDQADAPCSSLADL